jgi:hypothetical protein
MLLDENDFRAEQQYHVEKRKLHNKMLHGWGVVCGFNIVWEKDTKWFTIEHGYALDCHGNEIFMCNDTKIDLTSIDCSSQQSTPNPMTPADCEQLEDGADLRSYFIGIRYKDSMHAPVPVYIPDDDCQKSQCDYSRHKEGFCIEIRPSFPQPSIPIGEACGLYGKIEEAKLGKSELKDAVEKFLGSLEKEDTTGCNFCYKPPPCPSCCPEEHFVILGKLILNAADKTINQIDINECRTYVWTPHLFQYLHLNIFNGAKSFEDYVNFLYHLLKVAKTYGTKEYENLNLMKLFSANPIKALCLLGESFDEESLPMETIKDEVKQEEISALKEQVGQFEKSMEAIKKSHTRLQRKQTNTDKKVAKLLE